MPLKAMDGWSPDPAAGSGAESDAAAEAWTSTGWPAVKAPRKVAAGGLAGTLLRTCAGAGATRAARSLRAERATSQPDRSSKLSPTACFIRLQVPMVFSDGSMRKGLVR